MIVRIGNFLFLYRNSLFPVAYVLLFIEGRPIVPDYRLAVMAGFLIALSGQFLRAVTIGLDYIVRGGRNHQVYAEKLVQGGIFAHCRNPLYGGNFLILLGVGVAANSLLFLGIAIPFFAFAYVAIIAAEENYLRNKFGQEFDDYCARVPRFIPNFVGISQTLCGMRFNWRQLITAEYGSTYIWLAGIILVALKNLLLSGNDESARSAIWGLCTVFVVVTFGYAIARFLKKSGLLENGMQKN